MGSKLQTFVRTWLAVVRVVSAVAAITGIRLLTMGYPPQGSDSFILLFLGGVLALLGVVGVFDPARVTPSGSESVD